MNDDKPQNREPLHPIEALILEELLLRAEECRKAEERRKASSEDEEVEN